MEILGDPKVYWEMRSVDSEGVERDRVKNSKGNHKIMRGVRICHGLLLCFFGPCLI